MKAKTKPRRVRNVRKISRPSATDAFNSISQMARQLEDIERIRAFLRDEGAHFDTFSVELTIQGYSFPMALPREQVLRALNNAALSGLSQIANLLRAVG